MLPLAWGWVPFVMFYLWKIVMCPRNAWTNTDNNLKNPPKFPGPDGSLPTYHPRTITIFLICSPNIKAIRNRSTFCHAYRLPQNRMFIHEWVISPLPCELPSVSFTISRTIWMNTAFESSPFHNAKFLPLKDRKQKSAGTSFCEIILLKATDYCGTSSQGWLYSFLHEEIVLNS